MEGLHLQPLPESSSIFRSGDCTLHPSFIWCLISLSFFGAYIFQALQSNPRLWQYFGSKFSPFPLVAEALGTKLAVPWDRALPWPGTVLQLHLCSDSSDQQVSSGAAWNVPQFSVTRLWIISKWIFSIIVAIVLCFEIKFWMYIHNITGLALCGGVGVGGTFLCNNKSALNTVWLLSTCCNLNKFLIREFCTNENSRTRLLCADEMEKP